jgi:transposase
MLWLTGRLIPDFKTIADFRRANGTAIRAVCARYVVICGQLGLFSHAVAAIDGAKFKAVNSRDRNFTKGKLKRRLEQWKRASNFIFTLWRLPIFRKERARELKPHAWGTRSRR